MSTLVIAGTPRKAKIRLGPIIERYVGFAILAFGLAWVVWNAVSDPDGFKDSIITGINNGAMYALIALGYTMVYGIIELINFAHGDLFMLGHRPRRPTSRSTCSASATSRPRRSCRCC